MNDAQELGELIGGLLAAQDRPNVTLQVPEVSVRAEIDLE